MTVALPKSFFVTGTDTDVGKTVVSAILTLGLKAHYWKPVQSGSPADSVFIADCGVARDHILPERYVLSQPLSPHLAARIDGKVISLSDFSLPDTSEMDHLIVEGAGGLLVPLNDEDKVIDLIDHLQLPVLLVARSALGTINHTLLSLAALRQRSLDILGVMLTGEKNPENRKAIEKYGDVAVLAEIPVLPNFQRETLLECFAASFPGGWRGEERKPDMASVHANAYGRSST